MAVLKLSLLGPFIAALDNTPLDSFRTSKIQALLIYLAVENDRTHTRESLMELLWPGMPLESAQVNLRQTIYRLRKAIPEVDSVSGTERVALVLSDRQSVRLNPEAALEVDVAVFHTLIDSDPAEAVRLYHGDFLRDFYLVDSSEFESWAERYRENIRRMVLEVLDELVQQSIEICDHHQVQTFAWRQLEIDPLRESAYRQLMISLAAGGQRNAALAQYQVCQRRLQQELGLEPSRETTALYEQIQADALEMTVEKAPKRKPRAGEMPVFMLTDIEGSTRMWDTHRQAMLGALLTHNQILEQHIARHGGRILELRGDGVKAVFEGTDPLLCVLDIQQSLGEVDWGEIGDLRIRIGLHGVEPEHEDFDYFIEDDIYYGPVLNHTARVMDAGHGGQILVSEQVHNAFSLPQGASWQDHGRHKVKSLDHPLQLYGLVHPDLPKQSFPPLRTRTTSTQDVLANLPVIKNNLPVQTTPFIGREDELAELERMLADPEIRLVTIVGPGGMGKTRLALATMEQIFVNSGFPGGVFFIDLTPLDAASEIVSAIADTLNIRLKGQEDRSPLEQLLNYLQARKLLLLLDNCEHLLDGIEIVTRLLQGAADVQVLATSRERLHLSLEQVFPIDGLEFPDWETPEDAAAYPAVRLFLQSAHRNLPDFSLHDSSDLMYLARICRLVAGLPLALELAASWVDTLPLSEIAAGIQDGLDFLESDLRDLPTRHRSIRATIDHSWEKLDEDERTIFSRLTVFRGGFTREAAQYVTQANVRQLSQLVNKSFLQYNQEQDRYKIHEMLRQYGRSQLESTPQDELDTLRRRSEYYCTEVEKYRHLFVQGQIQTTLNLFKMDSVNILAAWDWAVKNKKIQLLNQAINGMGDYFDNTGRGDLGLARFESALDMLMIAADEDDDSILAQHLHAKILILLGHFNNLFRHDLAAQYFVEASKMIDQLSAKGVDARIEKSRLLVFQAFLYQMEGDYAAARNQALKAVELSREIGLIEVTWFGLFRLGNIAMYTGLLEEARKWYSDCHEFAKAHGHSRALFISSTWLGNVVRQLLAYEDALIYYEDAIELARMHEDRIELSLALGVRGGLEVFLGHFGRAVDYYSQAAAIIKDEYGARDLYFDFIASICVSCWLSGDFKQAESTIVNARRYITNDHYTQVVSIIFYAEYLTMVGQYQQAHMQIRSLDDVIQDEFINSFQSGRLTMVQGWIALARESYGEAHRYFNLSIKHYKMTAYDVEWVAWSQAGIVGALMFQHQWDEAYQILRQSLQASIRIKGIIPLMFTLPFACYYLAHENPDLASEIYAQIQTSPFLKNAQFFKDTVYKRLPEEIRQSGKQVEVLRTEPDLIKNLWKTASKIIAVWETE